MQHFSMEYIKRTFLCLPNPSRQNPNLKFFVSSPKKPTLLSSSHISQMASLSQISYTQRLCFILPMGQTVALSQGNSFKEAIEANRNGWIQDPDPPPKMRTPVKSTSQSSARFGFCL